MIIPTGFRSPTQRRKPKNIEQTERLMMLGNAVMALVVHMQQLLDEEVEIQEEKNRLRTELVEHIKQKEGDHASKLSKSLIAFLVGEWVW